MIDQDLLAILCCPETKQDLYEASSAFIEELNEKIKKGEISNKLGEIVKDPADSALVREDKAVIYLVREQIPIMLIDESILIGDELKALL